MSWRMWRVRQWSEDRFGVSGARAGVVAVLLSISWQGPVMAQTASGTGSAPARAVTARGDAGGMPGAWARGPVAVGRTEAPQQLLMQAESDLQEGRSAQAYQLLEDVIARYPGSMQAERAKDLLVEQFRALRRGGDTKEAADGSAGGSRPDEVAAPRETTPVSRAPAQALPNVLRSTGDFKTSIGDRVFFDAGSSSLDARQSALLRAQAGWLVAHADARVRIEARADDPGNEQANADLARDRAEHVRAVLVAAGVSRERISVAALGNGRPIATCGASPRSSGASPCAGHNRVAVTVVEWAPELLPRRRLVTGAIDKIDGVGKDAGAVGSSATPETLSRNAEKTARERPAWRSVPRATARENTVE